MNDLGVLASGIVTYDFPNDTGSYNMGFVSGWLETNITSGLAPVEKNIFSSLYELWYYEKSARESLRSFTYSDSVDWVTIKEGDTTIQRQNKNSVAKTYRDLSEQTSKRLKDLVFQYNYQKSSPIQVAGTDGTFDLSGKLT